ncbi:hypothetical protein ABU162_19345 [Paenibacillus thiaminolyticus]|uniref:hypothetical protein n=1 Tax=Paenibacillus thiaminolyticus TaxID=49283 RepID=UPI0035A72D2C
MDVDNIMAGNLLKHQLRLQFNIGIYAAAQLEPIAATMKFRGSCIAAESTVLGVAKLAGSEAITEPRLTVTHLLESNGVEFLILSDHIPIKETRFYASTFHQDHLIFIEPPHHPLAQQDMCTLCDFQHETL